MSCAGISKKTGKPCTANVQRGKAFCFRHDPDRLVDQQEASHAGAVARTARTPPPHELAGLPILKDANSAVLILASTVKWIFAGQLDPRHATAIATCIRAFSELRRDEELEDKLKQLEAAVNSAPAQLSNGHAAA